MVHLGELSTGDVFGGVGVGVLSSAAYAALTNLEVEVVLAVFVELGGRSIETDLDFPGITSLFDSLSEKLEGVVGASDGRREATFVSYIGRCTISPTSGRVRKSIRTVHAQHSPS